MAEFEERIKRFRECLEKNKDDFEIPVLQDILVKNKDRIHNNGLDSEGFRIGIKSARRGSYSPGYERVKGRVVRRLYPINLFLNGDLSRAQELAKDNGDNVIWLNPNITYNGLTSAELAQHHEDTYRTQIFTPNVEAVTESIAEVGDAIIGDFIRNCLEEAGFIISGNLDSL